ncbi:MAG: hypothetical protein ACI9TY_001082 [Alphaproteobacteria bacterium]|jgi:hypothetical protein
MLKLCFTAILGTFIIYGLDEMDVITSKDFTYIEEPTAKESLSNTHNVTKAPITSKFTDRIVQKRQQQKG